MYGSTALVTTLFAIASLAATHAHPAPSDPSDWYHKPDSPVAALFVKRAANPDDPNFASNYPPGWQAPPASSLPKAWTDKLASLQLPDIQPSQSNNGYPTYTGNEKGGDDHICSFTYECTTKDDLVAPPDGILALNFDDGPSSSSPALNDFLAKNNMSDKATHFMIGGSILGNPKGMQATAQAGGHIAVHTWSHQYMTTLSNEQILGELGWTMQIIADLNGGRIAQYWRPPFGDVDNRVRAIASGVFGLKTCPWSHDSGDWALSTGQYTRQQIDDSMNEWLTGPKSPGLNILEHELNDNSTSIFFENFPKMVSNGWNIMSIADAWGLDWYQNAKSNTGEVISMEVAGGPVSVPANNASSAPASSQSASSAQVAAASGPSSAQSQTSASTTSTTSASAQPSAGVAGAALSPSQTGGASAMTQPGLFLALLGVVGAALL